MSRQPHPELNFARGKGRKRAYAPKAIAKLVERFGPTDDKERREFVKRLFGERDE